MSICKINFCLLLRSNKNSQPDQSYFFVVGYQITIWEQNKDTVFALIQK